MQNENEVLELSDVPGWSLHRQSRLVNDGHDGVCLVFCWPDCGLTQDELITHCGYTTSWSTQGTKLVRSLWAQSGLPDDWWMTPLGEQPGRTHEFVLEAAAAPVVNVLEFDVQRQTPLLCGWEGELIALHYVKVDSTTSMQVTERPQESGAQLWVVLYGKIL